MAVFFTDVSGQLIGPISRMKMSKNKFLIFLRPILLYGFNI